uniref:Uncharacterized protein n=1 Tax=viral metagenome TaxID=1070528 RepID=A0A6C0HRV4_9ZZZZ
MFGSSSQPQYIPEYAENLKGDELLTPAQANVSGDGTSDVTLKRDFSALSSYLCAITGGCKSDSSIVTTDGTYNFGSKYFFNTNNKCTLTSSENIQYCDPTAKPNQSVYQYIYINTKSDGLLKGVLSDVENMATIPFEMIEIMSGLGKSNCKCVPLKVSGKDGGESCAAAFISEKDAQSPDVIKNMCSNNIMDPIYNLKTPQSSGLGTNFSGSSIPSLPSFGFGKSGFTTMYVNHMNNIEMIFFIIFGILMLIILYKVI